MNKSRVYTIVLLVVAVVLMAMPANAQKRPTKQKVNFTVEEMPDQLLTFLNGILKDEDKLEANKKLVDAFAAVYNGLGASRQEEVVDLYNAARQTKMSPLPDYAELTTTLMAYQKATVSPTIFAEWIAATKAIMSLTTKTKEITGFISYSAALLADRTLYGTRSCVWQAQPNSVFSFVPTNKDVKTVFDTPINLRYTSGTSNNADENTIYGTKGAYLFLDNLWKGQGGRLTWERCGVAAGACYADLQYYTVVTKFPKFTADSVLFINTNYFKSPIKGAIEEALNSKTEPDKYNFPKFRSYQKDFQLKDVMPGVDFEGSFMMYGPRFVTNDEKSPASMVFYRGGKRFMTVSSTKFTLLPHMLTSERAAVKIFVDNDSICNTGLLVRYTTADQRVNLNNSPKRNYYSPYTDSYHQLDIYCESINWWIAKDILEFDMVAQSSSETNVTFESNRYYSVRKAREVQGIDEVSPVVRMYRFMKDHDMRKDFGLVSFQKAVGLDEAQTKLMVHNLSKSGLVSFDEGSKFIHVHDKLLGFYKAISKQKGHDYDALTLESDTKGTNAEMDLTTNDLRVHGVEKFVVSDSQLVVVKPYGGDILVKRNRDIIFSGYINVGRFEMNVTDATFFYDEFRFDLPQIDSLRFWVTSFTEEGKQRMVRTPLYSLVGDIQIDKPDNHCGLQKNKDYPIFNSVKTSYVYYDRPFVLGGVYNRDRFYYTLNPFVIKQLTDFVTDSLEFSGTLTSAGIFPDIAQPLKVQRDYSLGFINTTPQGGYETYGGKGRYFDTVALSYGGLRGKGRLEYLTSVMTTDKYIFMPDSTVAQTDTFYVKEENDFPDIHNGQTIVRWYPYRDSMTVSQMLNGSQFQMYHGETQLAGRVTLQPKGAAATGTATLHEGTLRSPWFQLRSKEMDAKQTHFSLFSMKYNNVAFEADNMRSHVDYEEHTGQFTSNDTLERTLLPALGYAAWVDQYTWDWDDRTLALDNSKSTESGGMEAVALRDRAKRMNRMPGARFESTDPKLKNIRFCAIHSDYRYDDLELSNHNVFALPIADALIAPSGDSLHISKGGEMSLIKNGSLLAERDSCFHLFYKCDIMVTDGKKYGAKGYIDYVSEDDKKQPIYMTEIAPDANGMTVANGFVSDTARFTLSQAFGFAGKVRVEALKRDYYFDGGVRLLHNCAPVEQLGLLAYADYLDPENIRVTVSQNPVDWKGNPINAGIRMDQNSLKPTSSFLTKHQPGIELISGFGLLHFDNATNSYTITTQDKLDDNDYVDHYLTLHGDDCTLEGEGPISIGQTEAPASIYAYGKAFYDPYNLDNFSLNTVFGVNFPINEDVLAQMAKQIEEDLRPGPADRDNDLLEHALMYGMGHDEGQDAYMTYQSTGAFDKIPQCINNTLLFEKVHWEYSVQRGYTASGTVALCNVGKKQLHVNVRLRAQLTRRSGDNHLVIYMQLANDHWYYFHYEMGSKHLSIASSNAAWNDKILDIKSDKRKVDGFSYSVVNSRAEMQSFLSGFTGDPADEEEEDYDNEEEDD